MSDYAVLFPGQGSQNKNMLVGYDNNEIFNDYIDKSSQILGYDIKKNS
jgi:malonyl CoA-acyl carrier protein transacylase